MIRGLLSLLFLTLGGVLGAITDDFSCASGGVYSQTATSCSNNLPDAVCAAFYPEAITGAGYPAAGNSAKRPFKCTGDTEPKPNMKSAAILNCAKTCGFCCLSSDYNCADVAFPRLDCKTITSAMCESSDWRQILAEDCPASCGFCKLKGCVDIRTDCSASMCNDPTQSPNCKRTCGKCPVDPILIGDPCVPSPDTNSNCATWAAGGFCTNDFYTHQQRKQYCSFTCKIC